MVESVSLLFLGSAFFAGLITFLAPCTLPLVPAYLGFISGVSKRELENPETAPAARKKIRLNGVAFVLGFSLVFVSMGTLVGLLGGALTPVREWATRLGGVVVIVFGLFLLGVFRIPFLARDRRIKIPSWLHAGEPSSSVLVGAAFALGWTPCVGPILGSILLLASSTSTAFTGALMLAVFSAGLALPFLLLALLYAEMTAYIHTLERTLKIVSIVGGVFLILLGIMLLTGEFALLTQWGFRALDSLNYEESLLQFL